MMKIWELYVIYIMLPMAAKLQKDFIDLHRQHCARWYWLEKELKSE